MSEILDRTTNPETDAIRTRPPNQWKANEAWRAFNEGGFLEYSVEQLVGLYDRLKRFGGKIIEHSDGAS